MLSIPKINRVADTRPSVYRVDWREKSQTLALDRDTLDESEIEAIEEFELNVVKDEVGITDFISNVQEIIRIYDELLVNQSESIRIYRYRVNPDGSKQVDGVVNRWTLSSGLESQL